MPNLVFYDFETCSSNVSYGQIIQAAAVLVNDNFQELDRYEGRCKLSPGVVPEAMALLVNKTTPKMLKETNLSHYQMVRQLVDKFKQWNAAFDAGFAAALGKPMIKLHLVGTFRSIAVFIELVIFSSEILFFISFSVFSEPLSGA